MIRHCVGLHWFPSCFPVCIARTLGSGGFFASLPFKEEASLAKPGDLTLAGSCPPKLYPDIASEIWPPPRPQSKEQILLPAVQVVSIPRTQRPLPPSQSGELLPSPSFLSKAILFPGSSSIMAFIELSFYQTQGRWWHRPASGLSPMRNKLIQFKSDCLPSRSGKQREKHINQLLKYTSFYLADAGGACWFHGWGDCALGRWRIGQNYSGKRLM